ncbi:MAG: hypothetical protein V1664_03205 [Candidatus Uhrbacteria bacterium]
MELEEVVSAIRGLSEKISNLEANLPKKEYFNEYMVKKEAFGERISSLRDELKSAISSSCSKG